MHFAVDLCAGFGFTVHRLGRRPWRSRMHCPAKGESTMAVVRARSTCCALLAVRRDSRSWWRGNYAAVVSATFTLAHARTSVSRPADASYT